MDSNEALNASGPEPDYFDGDPLVWAKRVAALWVDCDTCNGTGRTVRSDGLGPRELSCPDCVEGRRLVASDELKAQYGVKWCIKHDSEIQQTICAKHDLASRRAGSNPFEPMRCVGGWRLVIPIGDE